MGQRFVCVHGHFYQPPRENPWLEEVQLQPSAHPYHDWNERVTAECYAANASSRILDEKGLIREMVNNYAMMSFNFGPTLLSWLELKAPEVYNAILEADAISRERFSGHGAAIAQAYNHMIMPLANSRDKRSQILWGIADFKHRFGRMPEGMWLPETAVDLESLDLMAKEGIAFTILAPRQVKRVRPVGSVAWTDVREDSINTSMPYLVRVPSGGSIAVFFYNGPISRAVAFERLLSDGETFALRLGRAFDENSTAPQLSHIATDGETYGHHHRFGDMALAYALRYIESNNLAIVTIYGEYLEHHPPEWEAEILECTSWSCAHGVERWRSNCGCRLGAEQGWSQAWRRNLREAMDWLRDELAGVFEREASSLLKDPWRARDDYITVILDRSDKAADAFISRHAAKALDAEAESRLLSLMEMQRHAMLMYTSCGWFFDDPSGIETIQIVQYAARAIELARHVSGRDLEEDFLSRLEKVRSNKPGTPDGRAIFAENIRPAVLSLERVAAHHAMSTVLRPREGDEKVYCYTVRTEDRRFMRAGRSVLMTGRMTVRSNLTWHKDIFSFAVLHLGDHNMLCCTKGGMPQGESFGDVAGAFLRGNIPESVRLMERECAGHLHSIESLLKDGQNEVLDMILAPSLKEAEDVYRRLYEEHAPLMRYLKEAGMSPPKMLYLAAEAVLNRDIANAFAELDASEQTVKDLMEEVRTQGIILDEEALDYQVRKGLVKVGRKVLKNPLDRDAMQRLVKGVLLLEHLPFRINLWDVQNVVYKIIQRHLSNVEEAALRGDAYAPRWIDSIRMVAKRIYIAMD
jgi:hypothetical protein